MSIPTTPFDPPELEAGTLRIVPLGGLGEVGRNMTVFEYGGKLLVVDCGVLFPEEHQPGVDLILPDFTWIRDRLDDVVGVVLTHGHEDHIGAVPFLLRERHDIPLVGSRFTLALVTDVPGADFSNFRPDRNAAAGGALPKVSGTTR